MKRESFEREVMEMILKSLHVLKGVEKQMSDFTTSIAQVEADLTEVKLDITNVIVPGVASLNQSIVDLKNQLASGPGLNADQQAALDKAVADADALKSAADGVASGFGGSTSPTPNTSGFSGPLFGTNSNPNNPINVGTATATATVLGSF